MKLELNPEVKEGADRVGPGWGGCYAGLDCWMGRGGECS